MLCEQADHDPVALAKTRCKGGFAPLADPPRGAIKEGGKRAEYPPSCDAHTQPRVRCGRSKKGEQGVVLWTCVPLRVSKHRRRAAQGLADKRPAKVFCLARRDRLAVGRPWAKHFVMPFAWPTRRQHGIRLGMFRYRTKNMIAPLMFTLTMAILVSRNTNQSCQDRRSRFADAEASAVAWRRVAGKLRSRCGSAPRILSGQGFCRAIIDVCATKLLAAPSGSCGFPVLR